MQLKQETFMNLYLKRSMQSHDWNGPRWSWKRRLSKTCTWKDQRSFCVFTNKLSKFCHFFLSFAIPFRAVKSFLGSNWDFGINFLIGPFWYHQTIVYTMIKWMTRMKLVLKQETSTNLYLRRSTYSNDWHGSRCSWEKSLSSTCTWNDQRSICVFTNKFSKFFLFFL